MSSPTQNSLAYGSSGSPKVPHKFSNIAASNTTSTQAFINNPGGGADSIHAMGLRPQSVDQSVAARQSRVGQEMAQSLARLANGGS